MRLRALWGGMIVLIGCGGGEGFARDRASLEAVCDARRAASGWKCGEGMVAECGAPVTLFVPQAWAEDCDALRAEPQVTWPAGDMEVSVYGSSEQAVCRAQLSIRDTIP